MGGVGKTVAFQARDQTDGQFTIDFEGYCTAEKCYSFLSDKECGSRQGRGVRLVSHVLGPVYNIARAGGSTAASRPLEIFSATRPGKNPTAPERGEINPGVRNRAKCYIGTTAVSPMSGLPAADKNDAENAAQAAGGSPAICFTVASIGADLIGRQHA